jgi:hypothetical protein
MIGCFFYAFQEKNKTSLFCGLISLLIFCGLYLGDTIDCKNQKNITIYTISKSIALNFNQNGKSILLSDSIRTKKDNRYLFSIKNHERKARISSEILNIQEDIEDEHFFKKGSFLFFHGKTFYILSSNTKLRSLSKRMKIDYLYLTRNPKVKPELVFKVFDCDRVIIDENNGMNLEREWVEYCMEQGVDCYLMREHGAIIVAL